MFAAITYWQLYVFYGGGYCYFIWKMNDLVSVFCICYKSINPLTAISSFLRSSSQTFWLKPGVSQQKPISGPPPIRNSHRRLFNLRLYPGSHVWLSPHGTATCYIIGGHSWEKGMKTPAWMEFTESNVFLPKLTRMMYLCSNNFHAINVYNAKVVFARRQSDQVLLQLKDG